MGLFGKNWKKINEQNRKDILKLIDQVMTVAPDQSTELNNIKNNILAQQPSDSKELNEIDLQIIAQLNEAKALYSQGNGTQARTYIKSAKDYVAKRTGADKPGKNKKKVEIKLSADQLQEIMLAEAQDKVLRAQQEYNETAALAQRGDMAAQARLQTLYQRYNISMQNFKAIEANLTRESVALMMKEFTEEQMERIANRTISDEELTVIVEKYQLAGTTATGEASDAANLGAVINDQTQSMQAAYQAQGLPTQLGAQGFAAQGLPSSIGNPGAASNPFASNQASANPFASTGANPFASTVQGDDLGMGSISDTQLRGSLSLLETQIDDRKDELEEKRADRRELDSRMQKLLAKHSQLPDAQAVLLESEIDSLQVEIENSDFELKMIEQEVLELTEKKGLITKLLSVKTRSQREGMLKQRFGNNFNIENFATIIASAQESYNAKLQAVDDANAVTRGQNTQATRSTVDAGGTFTAKTKKNYDDLKKSYGVEQNN